MTLKKCIIFFVFFCCFTRTSEDEDLYKVLGVKKTATSQDIKKAYKSLAREWSVDVAVPIFDFGLIFCNCLADIYRFPFIHPMPFCL